MPPSIGGRPLPSFVWQPEQELRLNKGPKPSRDLTEAGAVTQLVLNILLPKVNFLKSSISRVGEGLAKASVEELKTVKSPPDFIFSGTGYFAKELSAKRHNIVMANDAIFIL